MLGLHLLSVLASRLPPFRPLSHEEEAAIRPALEAVVYKWSGNLSPEAQLVAALGGVALGRFAEWRSLPPELQEAKRRAASDRPKDAAA